MNGIDALGPWPEMAVAALWDLGLTDKEIARYYRVDLEVVQRVRFRNVSSSESGITTADVGQQTPGSARAGLAQRSERKRLMSR